MCNSHGIVSEIHCEILYMGSGIGHGSLPVVIMGFIAYAIAVVVATLNLLIL